MQTDPISPVVLLQDEDENEDEEEEEDPLLHVNLGNKMFQHMFSVSSLEGTDNPEIQRLEFRGCVWWQKT
jgi:hypothetical protein